MQQPEFRDDKNFPDRMDQAAKVEYAMFRQAYSALRGMVESRIEDRDAMLQASVKLNEFLAAVETALAVDQRKRTGK